MSRRAAIYGQGQSAKEAHEAVRQLQDIAMQRGWTVSCSLTDIGAARGAQWRALLRKVASGEVDMLLVPSFKAIAENVSDAVKETLRLRDAGCGLYVADAALDTTSPVDRVLFRVTEALSALDADTPEHAGRRRQQREARPELTQGQRSLIRAALGTGMGPLQVARNLEMPIEVVRAVQKNNER